MKDSPGRPKFAVVREDSQIEAALLDLGRPQTALVVASGGCTALDLLAQFPALEVTAFDWNPRQLEQVQRKAAAARRGELRALNVGDDSPEGLNQSGEFEGVFRLLRTGIREFVASAEQLERFFSGEGDRRSRAELLSAWFAAPHWPALFSSLFSDDLLHALFGLAATQHAVRGSYSGYFRKVFERGLGRPDAPRNRFLQHVLLGLYLAADAPLYTRAPTTRLPELIEGSLPSVPALERFDLFSLSNVFDWSDDALVESWAAALHRARPGARLLLRQLNNQRDLRRFFQPAFRFDEGLANELLGRDQSLFYERLEVGVRT